MSRSPSGRGAAARHGARVLATVAVALASVAPPAAAGVSITEWSSGRAIEPIAARERAQLIAQLRSRPQDAEAHIRHGQLLARDFLAHRTADWRPAAAAFQFALQLDPSLSGARLELGRLYSAVGRAGLAQKTLAEYVALNSGDAEALADLSLAALRSGDLTVALWAGRKASSQSQTPRALAAGALSAGVADASDARALLDKLRAAAPALADTVGRDVAAWRQGAAIAATLPVAAPVPPSDPTAQGGPQRNWRSCDQSQSGGALGGYPSYGSTSGAPIGPQPLAALPGPCADTPQPAMAVIEAVIVRQRDEGAEVRGVNLLSTLELVARGRVRVTEERAAGMSPQNNNFLTLSLPDEGLSYLLDILDDQTSRADVLAKPSLVALDRTPSLFFSGATITLPVSGQYTSTLQEKAIGVSLAVTPTFLSDDEMLLAVNAARSFLEPGLEAQLEEGIQTTTNTVTANVRLRFGETLVLSGLIEREESLDGTEVPVLGRLPIGNLFLANRTKRRLRNNVIVLLTPRRPNEAPTARPADDTLLPANYDRRLAQAMAALARSETPEAATLDDLSSRLARSDLVERLPITLLAQGR